MESRNRGSNGRHALREVSVTETPQFLVSYGLLEGLPVPEVSMHGTVVIMGRR